MQFDTYQLLTPLAAQELVIWSQTQDWAAGLARTKEATGTIKKNRELRPDMPAEDEEAKEHLDNLRKRMQGLGETLSKNTDIQREQAPRKMRVPKLNRYGVGEEYQRHGDAAVMGGNVRTDLACTIFLSHPDTYEGGGLCVEDASGDEIEIKGDPGMCVIYPCHMPHRVLPVTSGERISAITWIESQYRDVEQRLLMRRFLTGLQDMEKDETLCNHPLFTTFGSIHSRLQRLWLEYGA